MPQGIDTSDLSSILIIVSMALLATIVTEMKVKRSSLIKSQLRDILIKVYEYSHGKFSKA